MNTSHYLTRYRLATLCASMILLTACGGGGGGSNNAPLNNTNQPTAVDVIDEPQVTDAEADDAAVTESDEDENSNPVSTPVITTPPLSAINPYDPDSARLAVAAGDSSALYVEPDFTFDQVSSTQFYITVHDSTGLPSAGTLVSVYKVPADAVNWHDITDVDQELILKGITDSNGVMDQTMEIPGSIQKVMLVANIVGIENKALVELNTNTVSFHFE